MSTACPAFTRCNYLAKPGNPPASSLERLLFNENKIDKMLVRPDGNVALTPKLRLKTTGGLFPPTEIGRKQEFSNAGPAHSIAAS